MSGAVDLSREAIEARRLAKVKTGRDGGATGRELIETAARVMANAVRLQKAAYKRPKGKKRAKLDRRADQALMTAAVQIRIADLVPLDKGYLHHLALPEIQAVKEKVKGALAEIPAELAVDTHRRIQDQRRRVRREAGG